jgi:riboflavin kinase/FMN adenylyltransferase
MAGLKTCTIEPGRNYEPTVVALGNFDGVHIGHQELLQKGLQKAKTLNIKLSVLLFDPHPLKVLFPDRNLNLLTGKEERLRLFEEIGVDQVFLFPFTPEFAETSPREFVEKILLRLGSKHIVVGFNYSFGCRGKGNPADLEKFGIDYGFSVEVIQAQKIHNQIISSTEIRKYLLNGEIKMAKEMMGRSPRLCGKVIHGDERGRDLGYPTANIITDKDILIPKNGVYAVTSNIEGKIYGGMMNIGIRPTFKDSQERTIEIHFLNYQGNLYDKELIINIEGRLRAERKFNGRDEIVAQLKKDKDEAITVLSPLVTGSLLI